MIAIGSIFSTSNSITRPQYLLPVATGRIRRRFTPLVYEKPAMSEVMRSAQTPQSRLPPSWVFMRY